MKDKRILLVEDNPDDEELTLRALKKSRIKNEVDVVRNGQEALDFLFGNEAHPPRDTSTMPQVVMLDLKLPKIDGIDVLKQIRAHEKTKYLPVVILTSSREEKDLLGSYSNGANSYIVKPVDTQQFIEAISQLGLYWLVINESVAAK